jgi:hypothetical protein
LDPTLALILGALWVVINLISSRKKTPPPRPSPREQPPPSQSGADATQREGSRLESVLRQFQQALEEAEAGPLGRQARLPLPSDEEVEERESLEGVPEVVSLEEEVHRPVRREYTQDADAEQLVRKRIIAASSRDHARTKAEHLEFDQKIRKEPADKTATGGYTAKQLRDAVVWREILGPPVSERDER